MMYSQFEDMMLLALYQEHMSFGENDIVSFAKVVAKYGIEVREGWLIEAQKNLLSRGLISGPRNASNDYMAIGKISARGMREIEDRWGTDDGVGLPLKPLPDEVEAPSNGVEVPAADRIVSITHNSDAALSARSALSDLTSQLATGNDFGNLSEAEVEEAKREVWLLEQAIKQEAIRIDWIEPMAKACLLWIATKAAEQVVGTLALAALAALAVLIGFSA